MDNFDYAFKKTIGHEGGYQNDPKDRGNWTTGEIGKGQNKGTKFGISAMSYPKLDIRNLTLDQAKEIYKQDYWIKSKAPEFPTGVDFMAFDIAVNHGVGRAVRMIQEAAGVKADGIFGPKTNMAVRGQDRRELLANIATVRDKFFADLNNPRFEKGWLRRSNLVLLDAYDLYLAKDRRMPVM